MKIYCILLVLLSARMPKQVHTWSTKKVANWQTMLGGTSEEPVGHIHAQKARVNCSKCPGSGKGRLGRAPTVGQCGSMGQGNAHPAHQESAQLASQARRHLRGTHWGHQCQESMSEVPRAHWLWHGPCWAPLGAWLRAVRSWCAKKVPNEQTEAGGTSGEPTRHIHVKKVLRTGIWAKS